MLTSVEKVAKTVEEAVKAALIDLEVDKDRVEIEIIDAPSKGFLGLIGTKPAKVRVTLKKRTPFELALTFLQDIFSAMKIAVEIRHEKNLDHYAFNLHGEDLGILIGKHGQTLDALQYLTNLAANHEISEEKVKIVIDVENYRKRREETLCRLAMRLADKVRRSGEKVILEPMSRHERKIIHTALQDERRVLTYSDGEEPYRKVVIALKK